MAASHYSLKFFIKFSSIFLLSTPVSADNLNIESYLNQTLLEQIKFKHKEIRYCPDNTCEIFRMLEPEPPEIFAGFVFLYLYYKSDYIYLTEPYDLKTPFRTTAKKFSQKVFSEFSNFCESTNVSPDCIIKSMQEKLGITISFSRCDESECGEAPL